MVEKIWKISDESPEKLLGYFPLKNLNDSRFKWQSCQKNHNLFYGRDLTNFH